VPQHDNFECQVSYVTRLQPKELEKANERYIEGERHVPAWTSAGIRCETPWSRRRMTISAPTCAQPPLLGLLGYPVFLLSALCQQRLKPYGVGGDGARLKNRRLRC
jgi:hypothetical protein